MIYIIEDDEVMAECIKMACQKVGQDTLIFHDAVSAMQSLNDTLPSLIFLDVLLTGPDGFTFLNELISYEDTAKIPVVIVSSLELQKQNLSHYGVVKILNKATMTPSDLKKCVQEYCHGAK